MKITFCPNDYSPTGICSFVSWENIGLQKAIRTAFHESPRERISEIVIERNGITAIFEPSNVATIQ